MGGPKAGKFMNPTDQARKEARRRELKKNKKQRALIREAVIKQKNPKVLLNEMEALDKMEFDPINPPRFSIQVIQDKRRKLKESFLKILQFYQREDLKKASELKQMEKDYEKRRSCLQDLHKSVIEAQQAKPEEIPLPSNESANTAAQSYLAFYAAYNQMAQTKVMYPPFNIAIPMPITIPSNKISISNATTRENEMDEPVKLVPPGPPSCSPPSLSDFEDDDQT